MFLYVYAGNICNNMYIPQVFKILKLAHCFLVNFMYATCKATFSHLVSLNFTNFSMGNYVKGCMAHTFPTKSLI